MGECVVASLKMMGVFRHFWSNDRVETPAECGEMGEALNCINIPMFSRSCTPICGGSSLGGSYQVPFVPELVEGAAESPQTFRLNYKKP